MKTNPNVFKGIKGSKRTLLDYLMKGEVLKVTDRYSVLIVPLNEEYQEIEYIHKETPCYATIEVLVEETMEILETPFKEIGVKATTDRIIQHVKNAIRKYEDERYGITPKKPSKKEIIRQKACEAIEYFNGWQEGDNITITADFVKYVEILKGLL